MGFTKALLIPSLGVATVTAPVHRSILEIVMALVIPLDKTISADARAAALHTIEAAKGD